jgi:hypothetical protein
MSLRIWVLNSMDRRELPSLGGAAFTKLMHVVLYGTHEHFGRKVFRNFRANDWK